MDGHADGGRHLAAVVVRDPDADGVGSIIGEGVLRDPGAVDHLVAAVIVEVEPVPERVAEGGRIARDDREPQRAPLVQHRGEIGGVLPVDRLDHRRQVVHRENRRGLSALSILVGGPDRDQVLAIVANPHRLEVLPAHRLRQRLALPRVPAEQEVPEHAVSVQVPVEGRVPPNRDQRRNGKRQLRSFPDRRRHDAGDRGVEDDHVLDAHEPDSPEQDVVIQQVDGFLDVQFLLGHGVHDLGRECFMTLRVVEQPILIIPPDELHRAQRLDRVDAEGVVSGLAIDLRGLGVLAHPTNLDEVVARTRVHSGGRAVAEPQEGHPVVPPAGLDRSRVAQAREDHHVGPRVAAGAVLVGTDRHAAGGPGVQDVDGVVALAGLDRQLQGCGRVDLDAVRAFARLDRHGAAGLVENHLVRVPAGANRGRNELTRPEGRRADLLDEVGACAGRDPQRLQVLEAHGKRRLRGHGGLAVEGRDAPTAALQALGRAHDHRAVGKDRERVRRLEPPAARVIDVSPVAQDLDELEATRLRIALEDRQAVALAAGDVDVLSIRRWSDRAGARDAVHAEEALPQGLDHRVARVGLSSCHVKQAAGREIRDEEEPAAIARGHVAGGADSGDLLHLADDARSGGEDPDRRERLAGEEDQRLVRPGIRPDRLPDHEILGAGEGMDGGARAEPSIGLSRPRPQLTGSAGVDGPSVR